jgi:alpha-1,2-mannosyltransferase
VARVLASWPLGAVFVVAFVVRLTTVLRGGGLYGVVGYDGSVYYTAAAGLAAGLLPYQDFLLLHPPGIVLALLPFAALGRLVGDPHAFALARLAWMALGAVNAVLVSRILRHHGRWPALAAGLFYAVYVPAVLSEHYTSLEAVGSTCLLLAVGLLTRPPGTATHLPRSAFLVAGLLLGVSSSTKIWGVVLALTVLAWTCGTAGWRRALLLLAGGIGGAVAVCLPFFLAAPATMWRMVVLDQLGRPRVDAGVAQRVLDTGGLSQVDGRLDSPVLLATLCVVVGAVAAVLAVRTPLGRLALLLFAVATALLVLGPSWSPRYAGLAGPPAALLLGSALATLHQRLDRRRGTAAAVVGVTLIGYTAASVSGLEVGQPLPTAALRPVLAAAGGCVTTDDPTVLIETGALRANLDAGCPLVADLGGYSYDLQPGASRRTSRAANRQWQEFALGYLSSGAATVVGRFSVSPGLSRATRATIETWPVLGGSGRYLARQPRPVPR